jgi:hypothetical protein
LCLHRLRQHAVAVAVTERQQSSIYAPCSEFLSDDDGLVT